MQFLASWFSANPYAGLLLILMVFDIASGILRAIQERVLSSNISGKGMRRKAMQLILILVGEALERFVGNAPISEFIAIGFCISEGMSIIENATLLGVPVPKFLTQVFANLGQTKAHQRRPDILDQATDAFEKDGLG